MIAFSLVYGKSGGKKFPRSIIKGNDASFSFLWSGRLLFSEFLNLGAVQTEGSEYTHCSQFPVKWMRAGAPFSSELFLTVQSGVPISFPEEEEEERPCAAFQAKVGFIITLF